MIKFFRKIRQKLLTENKFSKYFLYAIGEIVLVVIGILIALQINNSNMNKIQRANELKLLEELYSDYESNRKEVKSILSEVVNHQSYMDTIFDYLDNNKTLDESLLNSFHSIQGLPVFNGVNAAYKSIESNGISLLSESIIRKDATMLYDEYFRNINERRNTHFWLINNNLMPLMRHNFKTSIRYNKVADVNFVALNVPINLDILRINNEFKNTLYEIRKFLVSRKYLLEKTLSLLNEKMTVLESYIVKMEK